MIAYSHRAVAFVDILGFSTAIERSEVDGEYLSRLVSGIHSLRSPFYDEYLSQMAIDARSWLGNSTARPPEPRATQFSDSIVVSRPAKFFHDLVLDVAQIIHVLASSGLVCRGGVDVGALIHNNQILLGPAMIKAYHTENMQPYPAVVLPKFLAHAYLMKDFSSSHPLDWGRVYQRGLQAAKDLLVPLSSEYYFIDYFNDYSKVIQYDEGSTPVHFWKLREVIVNGLREAPSTQIYQKYAWMAERLNDSGIVRSGLIDPVIFNRTSSE